MTTKEQETAQLDQPDEDQLVLDPAAPLDERLEVAVTILGDVLGELPDEHPDKRLALAHLDAVHERATLALPIPPATDDEDA